MYICWHAFRLEVFKKRDNGVIAILFIPPGVQGTGDGGCMKSSTEQQIGDAKQSGNTSVR